MLLPILILIRWIVSYAVDGAIHLLNNRSQYDSFRTLATRTLKCSVTDAMAPILILRTQKY